MMSSAARMKPPHAERASAPPTLMRRTPSSRNLRHIEIGGEAHQQIDRLRRHGGNHGTDVLGRAQPGRIQAVRAGVCVGLEPRDRELYVGQSRDKTFGTADQQCIAAGPIDCFARRAQPLDGDVGFIQGLGRIAGGILDGQSRHTGFHGEPHTVRHPGGIGGETTFEVRIDGQVGRLDHLGQMIQHPIAGHSAISMAVRPCEAGAGGGQRLEADTLQIAGAANIPWIGNYEAAALVQAMKGAAFIGDAGTNMRH